MGKVRARKETGNLYMDFSYMGVRCREQTALPDSPANKKKVEALLKRIEALIVLDQFNYADFFPTSKNVKKFAEKPNFVAATESNEKNSGSSCPLFSEFAEQWFSEVKIEWRNSHIRNVRSLLDSSILPFFGEKSIDQVTKGDLMEYRSQQSKIPGRNGNTFISAKSLNNRMGLVKLIMDEASDRFGFENPYRNIKPLRLQKVHIEPFSLLEVNRIIENVREDYRNYYTLRFFTGMRSGEIDGLKWEYVDFDKRQILVRETLIAGQTEYTKTDGSQREIPMLGPVYDALKDQFQSTGRLSPYVFCNTEGKPLDQNNVTKRVWYPLLRYLGLKKRRPYQTRHTCATLLLASGEVAEWVARFLGHSSTEMLFKVYSRYIPNLTRMDGSAFENLVRTHKDKNDQSSD
ncbi:tyrosine-type recombinase/integrase [Marinobacterium sp. MBR-109]|jgi:integrase|uniref:Arm DNA-binding domain-containing protein n=1 Tax=Marinobacterium sp. MBR-109 TaxID=3156462 RepID=UPI0033920C69